MAKFRISFRAIVEREIEVPEDLVWCEAYAFVRDNIGWFDLAHSSAAKVTIETGWADGFDRLTPPSPELQARIDAVPAI